MMHIVPNVRLYINESFYRKLNH